MHPNAKGRPIGSKNKPKVQSSPPRDEPAGSCATKSETPPNNSHRDGSEGDHSASSPSSPDSISDDNDNGTVFSYDSPKFESDDLEDELFGGGTAEAVAGDGDTRT